MSNQPFHPKFVEAMTALSSMSMKQRVDSKRGQELTQQAMFYAPDELKDQFHQKAKEMGLIPKSHMVNKNGEPVYSAKQIADHFGLSEEDVVRDIDRLQKDYPDMAVKVSHDELFSKH